MQQVVGSPLPAFLIAVQDEAVMAGRQMRLLQLLQPRIGECQQQPNDAVQLAADGVGFAVGISHCLHLTPCT
jgi:hypothetical protein